MHYSQSIPITSCGFAVCKLSDAEMQPLWTEADKIMRNFNQATLYNDKLAGNIHHEYRITDCLQHLENLSNELAKSYYWHPDPDKKLRLAGSWINFQRKYEFNPPHHHDGDVVIVIYLRLPYHQPHEVAQSSNIPMDKNLAGGFQFQVISPDGKIKSFGLNTDKTFENTMIMFPAYLNHAVYPFSTSDDYRISISGNLYL